MLDMLRIRRARDAARDHARRPARARRAGEAGARVPREPHGPAGGAGRGGGAIGVGACDRGTASAFRSRSRASRSPTARRSACRAISTSADARGVGASRSSRRSRRSRGPTAARVGSRREPRLGAVSHARAGARRDRAARRGVLRVADGARAVERAARTRRIARAAADAWIHAASLGEALAVGPLVRELVRCSPTRDVPAHRHHAHRTRAARGARICRRRWRRSMRRRRCSASSRGVAAAAAVPGRDRAVAALAAARARDRRAGRGGERAAVGALGRAATARSARAFRELVGGLGGRAVPDARTIAQRWLALGAHPARTDVVGNLKNDALPEPPAERAPRARATLGLERDRPLLVLGSVRPGEARARARRGARCRRTARGAGRWWRCRATRALAELRAEATRAGSRCAGERAPTDGAWRWDDARRRARRLLRAPPTWRSWAAASRPTAATTRSSRRRAARR